METSSRKGKKFRNRLLALLLAALMAFPGGSLLSVGSLVVFAEEAQDLEEADAVVSEETAAAPAEEEAKPEASGEETRSAEPAGDDSDEEIIESEIVSDEVLEDTDAEPQEQAKEPEEAEGIASFAAGANEEVSKFDLTLKVKKVSYADGVFETEGTAINPILAVDSVTVNGTETPVTEKGSTVKFGSALNIGAENTVQITLDEGYLASYMRDSGSSKSYTVVKAAEVKRVLSDDSTGAVITPATALATANTIGDISVKMTPAADVVDETTKAVELTVYVAEASFSYNGVGYEDLTSAVAAVEDFTSEQTDEAGIAAMNANVITLLKDTVSVEKSSKYGEAGRVNIENKAFTLDLNGFTLTLKKGLSNASIYNGLVLFRSRYGTFVKIANSSDSEAKIDLDTSKKENLIFMTGALDTLNKQKAHLYVDGNIVLDAGKGLSAVVLATFNESESWAYKDSGAYVEINAKKVIGGYCDNTAYPAVANTGDNTGEDAKNAIEECVILGGEFVGGTGENDNAPAVQWCGLNGKLQIGEKDGETYQVGSGDILLSGKDNTALCVRGGTVDIYDGVLKSTLSTEPPSATYVSGGSVIPEGVGIEVAQHTFKPDVTVNIHGGEISGYYGIYEVNLNNSGSVSPYGSAGTGKVSINITGGTIRSNTGGKSVNLTSFTVPTQIGYNNPAGEAATGNLRATLNTEKALEGGLVFTVENGSNAPCFNDTTAVPYLGAIQSLVEKKVDKETLYTVQSVFPITVAPQADNDPSNVNYTPKTRNDIVKDYKASAGEPDLKPGENGYTITNKSLTFNIPVTVSGKNLKKTYNGVGTKGYWAGIGMGYVRGERTSPPVHAADSITLPVAIDSTTKDITFTYKGAAQRWSAPTDLSALSWDDGGDLDGQFVENGIMYGSLYFGLTGQTPQTGYAILHYENTADGTKDTIKDLYVVYAIDFTGITYAFEPATDLLIGELPGTDKTADPVVSNKKTTVVKTTTYPYQKSGGGAAYTELTKTVTDAESNPATVTVTGPEPPAGVSTSYTLVPGSSNPGYEPTRVAASVVGSEIYLTQATLSANGLETCKPEGQSTAGYFVGTKLLQEGALSDAKDILYYEGFENPLKKAANESGKYVLNDEIDWSETPAATWTRTADETRSGTINKSAATYTTDYFDPTQGNGTRYVARQYYDNNNKISKTVVFAIDYSGVTTDFNVVRTGFALGALSGYNNDTTKSVKVGTVTESNGTYTIPLSFTTGDKKGLKGVKKVKVPASTGTDGFWAGIAIPATAVSSNSSAFNVNYYAGFEEPTANSWNSSDSGTSQETGLTAYYADLNNEKNKGTYYVGYKFTEKSPASGATAVVKTVIYKVDLTGCTIDNKAVVTNTSLEARKKANSSAENKNFYGDTLTASLEADKNAAAATASDPYTYQWYRWDSSESKWIAIKNATDATYVITGDDAAGGAIITATVSFKGEKFDVKGSVTSAMIATSTDGLKADRIPVSVAFAAPEKTNNATVSKNSTNMLSKVYDDKNTVLVNSSNLEIKIGSTGVTAPDGTLSIKESALYGSVSSPDVTSDSGIAISSYYVDEDMSESVSGFTLNLPADSAKGYNVSSGTLYVYITKGKQTFDATKVSPLNVSTQSASGIAVADIKAEAAKALGLDKSNDTNITLTPSVSSGSVPLELKTQSATHYTLTTDGAKLTKAVAVSFKVETEGTTNVIGLGKSGGNAAGAVIVNVNPGAEQIVQFFEKEDLSGSALDLTKTKALTYSDEKQTLYIKLPNTTGTSPNVTKDGSTIASVKSSNEAVAKVAIGKNTADSKSIEITTLKAGSAEITVTTTGDKNFAIASATLKITVGEGEALGLAADDFTITYPTDTYRYNGSFALSGKNSKSYSLAVSDLQYYNADISDWAPLTAAQMKNIAAYVNGYTGVFDTPTTIKLRRAPIAGKRNATAVGKEITLSFGYTDFYTLNFQTGDLAAYSMNPVRVYLSSPSATAVLDVRPYSEATTGYALTGWKYAPSTAAASALESYEFGTTALGKGTYNVYGQYRMYGVATLSTTTPEVNQAIYATLSVGTDRNAVAPSEDLSYTWYADGEKITGAASASYTPDSTVVGKQISAVIGSKKATAFIGVEPVAETAKTEAIPKQPLTIASVALVSDKTKNLWYGKGSSSTVISADYDTVAKNPELKLSDFASALTLSDAGITVDLSKNADVKVSFARPFVGNSAIILNDALVLSGTNAECYEVPAGTVVMPAYSTTGAKIVPSIQTLDSPANITVGLGQTISDTALRSNLTGTNLVGEITIVKNSGDGTLKTETVNGKTVYTYIAPTENDYPSNHVFGSDKAVMWVYVAAKDVNGDGTQEYKQYGESTPQYRAFSININDNDFQTISVRPATAIDPIKGNWDAETNTLTLYQSSDIPKTIEMVTTVKGGTADESGAYPDLTDKATLSFTTDTTTAASVSRDGKTLTIGSERGTTKVTVTSKIKKSAEAGTKNYNDATLTYKVVLAKKASESVPTTYIAYNASTSKSSDGSIEGISYVLDSAGNARDYELSTKKEFDANNRLVKGATAGTLSVTGLTAGTYYLRLRETADTEASAPVEIVIGAEELVTVSKTAVNLTVKQTNVSTFALVETESTYRQFDVNFGTYGNIAKVKASATNADLVTVTATDVNNITDGTTVTIGYAGTTSGVVGSTNVYVTAVDANGATLESKVIHVVVTKQKVKATGLNLNVASVKTSTQTVSSVKGLAAYQIAGSNTNDVTVDNLEIGDVVTVGTAFAPAYTDDQWIEWTTSNAGVATVRNGVITIVDAGTTKSAIITAKYNKEGGGYDTSTVTVKVNNRPTAAAFDVANLTMATKDTGRKLTLALSAAAADPDFDEIKWETSDKTGKKLIVTPAGNKMSATLTASSTGSFVVTATASWKNADGETKSVIAKSNVSVVNTVKDTDLKAITLTPSDTLNLYQGDSKEILYALNPTKATNVSLDWDIYVDEEGKNIATDLGGNKYVSVDSNGVVTAKTNVTGTNYLFVKATQKKADGSQSAVVATQKLKLTVRERPTIQNIMLEPRTLTLKAPVSANGVTEDGGSAKITASIYPSDASASSLTWSVDNPIVAAVSADGTVTALSAGSTYVTVTGGAATSKVLVSVEEPVTDSDLNALEDDGDLSSAMEATKDIWIGAIDDQIYTGAAIKPEPNVYYGTKLLKAGVDFTYGYQNNINAADKAAEKAPTVKVSLKGSYSGSTTRTFTINPVDIGSDAVARNDVSALVKGTLNKGTNTYTSYTAQYLKPVVSFNGKNLGYNKQFTLAWNDTRENAYAAPGDYVITIKGIGNFCGTAHVNETLVNPATAVNLSKAKIDPDENSIRDLLYASKSHNTAYYSGYAIEPTYNVYFMDKEIKTAELHKDTDYTVTYTNNINAGTATVTFTGTGEKYYGQKKITFKILANPVNFATGRTFEQEARIKAGEKDVADVIGSLSATLSTTVVNKGTAEKPSPSYDDSFEENVSFTSGIMGKKTVIASEASQDDARILVPYAKGGAKPAIAVYYNGTKLSQGVDFNVSYKNTMVPVKNITSSTVVIGNGVATISGKGANYKGSMYVYYKIVRQDLSRLSLSAEDYIYSSKADAYKKAKITVTDLDGKKLSVGAVALKNDYYVDPYEWLAESAAPTAGSTVSFLLNGSGLYYTGRMTGSFRIITNAAKISAVKTRQQTVNWTGEAAQLSTEQLNSMLYIVRPGTKIEAKLYEGIDFEVVSYTNNLKSGTGKVTVRGIGLFGGTRTLNFKIVQVKKKKN